MIPRGRRPQRLRLGVLGRPEAGPGRLIAAWRDQRFTLVVSPLLLEELADALARPKFDRWSSHGRAASDVAGLAARSEHRPDPAVAEPSVRDPDDDYLVALARAERLDVLVSLDRDLLDARLADLVVEDPATFVARLE